MSFKHPTEDDLRKAAHDDERVNRIKKANEVFCELIRIHLEPLCQVLTRKRNLKVVPHPTQSFTDGKMIALRLPLELGGDTEHIKEQCGKRDEDRAMICPACYVLDDALANAAHEVAHITGESFALIDDDTKTEMFEKLLRPRIEAVDPTKVEGVKYAVMRSKSAMEVANKVDLYLPMVTNALEDVFVNERMYQERPGFRDPIVGTTVRTLKGGLLGLDGVKHTWAEAPLPARAIMTAYAFAAELEKVIPFLGTDLEEIIADDELRTIVMQVTGKTTAQERLRLALEALERLREHGLCVDDRSLVFETVKLPGAPVSDEECESGEGGDDDEESDDEPGGSGAKLIESDDEESSAGSKGSSPEPSEADDEDDSESDDDSMGVDESEADEADDEEADDGGASEADEAEDEEADDDPDDEARGGSDADDDEDEDEDDDEAAGKGDDSDDENDDQDDSDDDDFEDDGDEDFDEGANDFPDDDSDPVLPDEATSGIPKGDRKEVEMEAEESRKALEDFMGHGEKDDHDELSKEEFEAEVDTQLAEMVIEQKDLFDDISFNVRKVRAIEPKFFEDYQITNEASKAPTNSDIAPVQGHLRVMFTENRKMGVKRNLKSGPRLDTAHLVRVPLGDPRIYSKRMLPKKRDWAVTIGLDCSGSTGYDVSSIIKNGGYAMAELLSSLGIPFSMYGHTGRYYSPPGGSSKLALELYHVKNFEDPWNDAAKQRCLQLRGSQANLDGHTLEFYRRDIQARRATDKLIMYFTDGEMPAENYEEELRLLQKNIKVCQHRRIKLVGVGVGTDSPKKHGLDTIRYDSIKDLPKLISELGKRLSE